MSQRTRGSACAACGSSWPARGSTSDPVSLTDGAHLVVVAPGEQPVGSFAQFQVPLHQFLVSCVCLALLIDAHRPDGLVRVGHGSLRSRLVALRGSRIRRVCRNRNCWCCRCDADADHGNQGGLHWSSSCRWSLSASPHSSQRSPVSHLLRAACRRTTAGHCGRRPGCRLGGDGVALPEGVAASLAYTPVRPTACSRGSGAAGPVGHTGGPHRSSRFERPPEAAEPIDRSITVATVSAIAPAPRDGRHRWSGPRRQSPSDREV